MLHSRYLSILHVRTQQAVWSFIHGDVIEFTRVLSLWQVLYRALFPRQGLFPLVPPQSEMPRRAKEARVHKKLAHELLCSYHRGTVDRAKVQNWIFLASFIWLDSTYVCVFMSLLTQPATVFSINNKYYICEKLFIENIMNFWNKMCSFIYRQILITILSYLS